MHMQEADILCEAQRLRREMVADAARKFGNWFVDYRRARASRHEFSTFSPADVATVARDSCKIACNIDPLRGAFASNSDPL